MNKKILIVEDDLDMQKLLVDYLKKNNIMAYICYVPLHSAPMGRKLGNKPEDCPVTEDYGSRVLRLPLYYDLSQSDVERVVEKVTGFFKR